MFVFSFHILWFSHLKYEGFFLSLNWYFSFAKIWCYKVANYNSETLKIIQQLRNEAHRFGIGFHRDKRSKEMIASELDSIKGIGPVTKQLLLEKYKSVKRIKNLTVKQLSLMVGNAKAEIIFHYFKSSEEST